MLFLLRCTERGNEPHARKNKLRNDIAEQLFRAVPDARISFDVGRIYVEAERDITAEIAELHGVSSFSPCSVCDVAELGEHAVVRAREELCPGGSFRVKIRRTGEHAFSSNAKAAELGAQILAGVPGAKVDLRTPDVVLSIEIRDRRCFVCTAVIPGLDARSDGAAIAGSDAAGEAAASDGADGGAAPAPKFLVDAMLGTLASRLRALGFDTEWRRDTADSLLLREARAEQRIVLTQDRELAEIGGASAYFVRERSAPRQLDEVIERFGLRPSEEMLFTRCSLCNAPLVAIDKALVAGRVPERAFECYDAFWTCRACDKIYWKGSHYDEMRQELYGEKRRA